MTGRMQARRESSRALSLAVLVSGAAIAAGWLLTGDDPLRAFMPSGVGMRFSGAVGFAVAGLLALIVSTPHHQRERWVGVVLSWSVFFLLMLVLGLLGETLTKVGFGLDSLFVSETHPMPFTAHPGLPSLGALAGYLAVAAFGLVDILSDENAVKVRRAVSLLVAALGLSGLAGHALGDPALFFYLPRVSNAMSLETAVLDGVLGAALWLGARSGCVAGKVRTCRLPGWRDRETAAA